MRSLPDRLTVSVDGGAVFTLSWRAVVVCVALLSLLQPTQAGRTNDDTDDLAFLQPWFNVEKKDRETLAQRGVVVHGVPASNKQISVIAVCAVEISPDAFVARIRAVGNVKRREVLAGRFGAHPALADLAPLSLDPGDIDRLRVCRPGECALNLSSKEMSVLQGALSTDVQTAFRQVLLDRLRRYQSGGLAALPEYDDRSEPVRPAAVFSEILQQTPYLKRNVPAVAEYLQTFPPARTAGAESSLHWSKVNVNNKAVVMLTHLATFRPESGWRVPTVLTAVKQIYASRYMNGELTLWMLFAGRHASPAYLVHVNRSQLDELGGVLSWVKRTAIESRIKQEAAGAMAAFRDRLEERRH